MYKWIIFKYPYSLDESPRDLLVILSVDRFFSYLPKMWPFEIPSPMLVIGDRGRRKGYQSNSTSLPVPTWAVKSKLIGFPKPIEFSRAATALAHGDAREKSYFLPSRNSDSVWVKRQTIALKCNKYSGRIL